VNPHNRRMKDLKGCAIKSGAEEVGGALYDLSATLTVSQSVLKWRFRCIKSMCFV
jgi:hypothetical protein